MSRLISRSCAFAWSTAQQAPPMANMPRSPTAVRSRTSARPRIQASPARRVRPLRREAGSCFGPENAIRPGEGARADGALNKLRLWPFGGLRVTPSRAEGWGAGPNVQRSHGDYRLLRAELDSERFPSNRSCRSAYAAGPASCQKVGPHRPGKGRARERWDRDAPNQGMLQSATGSWIVGRGFHPSATLRAGPAPPLAGHGSPALQADCPPRKFA